MSEANLTGGNAGLPIKGLISFPKHADIDQKIGGQRYLRTGYIETDPAKFDNEIWADSRYSTFVLKSKGDFPGNSNVTAVDFQSNDTGSLILVLANSNTGEDPYVCRSNDFGATWTPLTLSGLGMTARNFKSVDYGAGKFVLVGSEGKIATTTDGITFTPRISNVSANLHAVRWNGSLFVAVGVGVILTSPDGINWTARSVPMPLAGLELNSVAFGNNKWVVTGGGGAIAVAAADAISWEQKASNLTGVTFSVVIFDSDVNKFFSCGASRVESSTDGESWALVTITGGPSFNSNTRSIAKVNGWYFWSEGIYFQRASDFADSKVTLPVNNTPNSFHTIKRMNGGALCSVGYGSNGQFDFFEANNYLFAGVAVQVALASGGTAAVYSRIS